MVISSFQSIGIPVKQSMTQIRVKKWKLAVWLVVTVVFFAVVPAADAFTETGAAIFGHMDTDLEDKRLEGAGIQFLFATKLKKWEKVRMDFTLEMSEGLYGDYAEGFEVCLVPGLRAYLPGLKTIGITPFMEAGLGLSYTNLDIDELGLPVNFRSFGGMGVRIRVSRGWNLDLGCRITHISNAGLDERNHGVSSIMPVIGLVTAF